MKRALLCLVLASGIASAAENRVKLPTSRADLARGEKLFLAHCGRCHGDKGDGGIGPSLAQPKRRRAPDDGALVQTILDGIRGTEMPGMAGAMSDREAQQTAAFVRTL